VEIEAKIEECLRNIKGIEAVFLLEDADRFRLLDIETDAEKKAFMGLGMCYNSGVREVLRCGPVFVGITTMDFDWGCQAHLLLKKGDEIVGEEVIDGSRIDDLKGRENVWFLHKNFAIYKDRVDFPQDLVDKKCCFEMPCLTPDEPLLNLPEGWEPVLCTPSTAGDIFLKRTYYQGRDERGTGTVLFGFRAGT
jgi:hypothetical protein